jgi:hypothetical protein
LFYQVAMVALNKDFSLLTGTSGATESLERPAEIGKERFVIRQTHNKGSCFASAPLSVEGDANDAVSRHPSSLRSGVRATATGFFWLMAGSTVSDPTYTCGIYDMMLG